MSQNAYKFDTVVNVSTQVPNEKAIQNLVILYTDNLKTTLLPIFVENPYHRVKDNSKFISNILKFLLPIIIFNILPLFSIIIGITNNNTTLESLSTWPYLTSAEWLIVFGFISSIFINILFLLGFLQKNYSMKIKNIFFKMMTYFLITIEGLSALFLFMWNIIGTIMIFTNGYSDKYYIYSTYIMMCFTIYPFLFSFVIVLIIIFYQIKKN